MKYTELNIAILKRACVVNVLNKEAKKSLLTTHFTRFLDSIVPRVTGFYTKTSIKKYVYIV